MDAASEMRSYTVRLRERGQMTIPQPVRETLAVQDGDVMTLVQIGDVLVLTARQPRVPELSRQFATIMEEEGVTLADLLTGLRDEREAIWRARQQHDAPDLR